MFEYVLGSNNYFSFWKHSKHSFNYIFKPKNLLSSLNNCRLTSLIKFFTFSASFHTHSFALSLWPKAVCTVLSVLYRPLFYHDQQQQQHVSLT